MGATERLVFEPTWIESMKAYVRPYWDGLVMGDLVTRAATGELSLEEMRGWMLQMYPVIHAFPKFLAEALIKVEDDDSRAFFIDNIRVERAHATHWVQMAEGFGIDRAALMELAEGEKPVLRDVQSLTDWLWYVNCKGSLPEAVAATSFAIEGAIGDISKRVVEGFQYYDGAQGVSLSPRTYKWFREHAHYDDQHPKVALQIVERYAQTPRARTRAMFAAKRSLQLLEQALLAATYSYTPARALASCDAPDKRSVERRALSLKIDFPERRFRERRGARLWVGT